MRFLVNVTVGLFFLCPLVQAQDASEGTLFENVVAKLESNYVDKDFRESQLPSLVERYRELAEQATTLDDQRRAVHRLLSNIPATHMGLLSESTFERFLHELRGNPTPTFGFELINLDDKYFAHNVLEGGPAAKAGLRRGDRIVFMNDELVHGNTRLDWRSDDSFLEDPAVHYLLCSDGDEINLQIERKWGHYFDLRIIARPYCTYDAARASAMVIADGDYKFGHIHLWMIHFAGVARMIKEKLEGDFADCDALILDLRGRGGNGMALPGIYDVLTGKKSEWTKPVVALLNKRSRSAKEVIAYEFKKRKIGLVVGERTAGAVIPATFAKVGHDSVLMYPTFRMGKYTDIIEGQGVAPDVWVNDAGPYSAGADPLLAAGLREAKKLVEASRGDSAPPDSP